MKIRQRLGLLPFALGLVCATGVAAAEPDSCRTVRMSDPGWTDIASTNALVGAVLAPLGYEQDVETLSVPITYDSLKNGRIDAFLGSWQPAQAKMLEPLKAANQVEVVGHNLGGVKLTLAVPANVAAGGVKTIDDLAAHADKFKSQIYGIDSGAAVNLNLQRMIDDKAHGLGGWELVKSSEQGMLAQVDRAVQRDDWIVFVGWEPHPMNIKHQLTYLAGAEEYLGPNFGSSEVYTLGRPGLAAECPNLAKLLGQVTFTVPLESELMARIIDEGITGDEAATAWLKAHPETVEPWLQGVTTMDGKPAADAVRASLGG